MRTRDIVIASAYAALYSSITLFEYLVAGPLAYWVVQVRVSDAMLPLPMIHGIPAVIGLTIGCVIANALITGNVIDVVFGSLANLISGILVVKASKGKVLLAALYPTVVVSVIVGSYLPILFPVWISIPSVLVGEFIAVFLIGIPLLKSIQKIQSYISS